MQETNWLKVPTLCPLNLLFCNCLEFFTTHVVILFAILWLLVNYVFNAGKWCMNLKKKKKKKEGEMKEVKQYIASFHLLKRIGEIGGEVGFEWNWLSKKLMVWWDSFFAGGQRRNMVAATTLWRSYSTLYFKTRKNVHRGKCISPKCCNSA